MNGRERVTRTLRFERPDRAPRHLWYLPGVGLFRAHELRAVQHKYPDDVVIGPVRYGQARR